MTASGVGGETLRVALAGSPNTGKSTLFNLLTGLFQHVGNWPGKTVERKTGTRRRGEAVFFFVDLPGSYSLTANSLEEETARDHIIQAQPDVVAVVVDASSLERNLYLVCELLELGVPLVVVLNMMDLAHGHGLQVEPQALESALGVPVGLQVLTHPFAFCPSNPYLALSASSQTSPLTGSLSVDWVRSPCTNANGLTASLVSAIPHGCHYSLKITLTTLLSGRNTQGNEAKP
jgi:ferrous iron transport protein B